MWKHVKKQIAKTERRTITGEEDDDPNNSSSSDSDAPPPTPKLKQKSSQVPVELLEKINGSHQQTAEEREARFSLLREAVNDPLRLKVPEEKGPLQCGNFICILCSREGHPEIWPGVSPQDHLKTGRHVRTKKRFHKVLVNRSIVLPESPIEVLAICDLLQASIDGNGVEKSDTADKKSTQLSKASNKSKEAATVEKAKKIKNLPKAKVDLAQEQEGEEIDGFLESSQTLENKSTGDAAQGKATGELKSKKRKHKLAEEDGSKKVKKRKSKK